MPNSNKKQFLWQIEDKILDMTTLNLKRNFIAWDHKVLPITDIANRQKNDENQFCETSKYLFTNNKNKSQIMESFIGNDYFSLAGSRIIINKAQEVIAETGFGSGSSVALGGMSQYYQQFINSLIRFKKCQGAIIFPSGYQASIGVIPALSNNQDLIIADKLIHQSHIASSKLSGAKFLRFQHNDIDHCQKLLEMNRDKFRNCLIISESIFSMDGDCGNIGDLWQLAKKYQANLIVDDAHGIGLVDYSQFFSESTAESQYLQIGTMSKALASIGGYVIGSKIIIEYLENFAKSAIYTTALPPVALAVANTALIEIINNKTLVNQAVTNKILFCQLFCNYIEAELANLKIDSSSKILLEKIFATTVKLSQERSLILPIIIGSNSKVIEITNEAKKNGFLIGAIRPPTVLINTSRLRLTFNSSISKKSIDYLAKLLVKLIINNN